MLTSVLMLCAVSWISLRIYMVIIFTRTKQDAQDISEKLMREGYRVSPLHGDMDQKDAYPKSMGSFQTSSIPGYRSYRYVAARGIDVNDITHVINL